MRTKGSLAAGMMLAAAMLIAPAGVLAVETAPLMPGAQEVQLERAEDARCLETYKTYWTYRGVTVSREWMRQARVGGLMLNLRLYTPQGEEIDFKQTLGKAQHDADGIGLFLRAEVKTGGILLQMDQHAMDVLVRVGITEITVADEDWYERACYQVADLAAVREALGLTDGEQLCVSGETDPVTVVGEDGVRRQVNL